MKTWIITLAAAMALGCLSAAFSQDESPLITVDLKDAEFVSALRAIMDSGAKSWAIDPGIQVTGRVTLHLENVRLEDALRELLRPYGLAYTLASGGVYIIQPKSEPRLVPQNPTGPEPSEPAADEEQVRVEKIKLTYTDPYEIWAVLTGNGSGNAFEIPRLTGLWPYGNDNSLIAKFGGAQSWSNVGQRQGQPPQMPPGFGTQGGWPDRFDRANRRGPGSYSGGGGGYVGPGRPGG